MGGVGTGDTNPTRPCLASPPPGLTLRVRSRPFLRRGSASISCHPRRLPQRLSCKPGKEGSNGAMGAPHSYCCLCAPSPTAARLPGNPHHFRVRGPATLLWPGPRSASTIRLPSGGEGLKPLPGAPPPELLYLSWGLLRCCRQINFTIYNACRGRRRWWG